MHVATYQGQRSEERLQAVPVLVDRPFDPLPFFGRQAFGEASGQTGRYAYPKRKKGHLAHDERGPAPGSSI